MNTAERITKNMNDAWFKGLVSNMYKFNRDVEAAEESELREVGFDWNIVHSAFCWKNLSKDFIREMVESDPTYKTQLEHELLMDIHGYSVHASYFYQNMSLYIQYGMAEQKLLVYYIDQIYIMYRNQAEQEYNSRRAYQLVDNVGRILDEVVI